MKTIEELAREAGFTVVEARIWPSEQGAYEITGKLSRFATLVREQALEEAANVCGGLSNDWHGHDGKYACEDAANRLRELKDSK